MSPVGGTSQPLTDALRYIEDRAIQAGLALERGDVLQAADQMDRVANKVQKLIGKRNGESNG